MGYLMRGLVVALALHPVAASAAAPDGDCFCLSNTRYDYFQWGCRAYGDAEAVCVSNGATGQTFSVVAVDGDWQRVAAGRGMCLPCMPDLRPEDVPDIFRGFYFKDPPAGSPDAGAEGDR